MADFAGTVALVGMDSPHGNHHGVLTFTITLSSTAYAGGNLNLSAIDWPPGVQASQVGFINFTVGAAAAGYMVSFLPAASPTFANLGTLKLYTATGTEATGSLTLTVQGRIEIHRVATLIR